MSRICTMYPHFGNFWSIFKLYIPITEDPDLTEIVVPSITGWSLVSYQSHSITLFADIQKSCDLYWIAIHISIINFQKFGLYKMVGFVPCLWSKITGWKPNPSRSWLNQPNATCAGRNAWDWMLGFSIPTPARWRMVDQVGVAKVSEYVFCVFFLCVFLLCLSVYVEKRALDLSFRTSMWQNTICQYFTMFLCVHKAGKQIDPTISSLRNILAYVPRSSHTEFYGHSGHPTIMNGIPQFTGMRNRATDHFPIFLYHPTSLRGTSEDNLWDNIPFDNLVISNFHG